MARLRAGYLAIAARAEALDPTGLPAAELGPVLDLAEGSVRITHPAARD